MSERPVPALAIDVFVVSENRLLREALGRLLRKRPGIRSVSAIPFVIDAVIQVAVAQPHVLLLDPAEASQSILPMIVQTKNEIPGLRVIAIGMECDLQTFIRFVQAGVAGYVLKDASGSDLAQAVLSVASGQAACPPDLCLGLFECFARQSRRLPDFRTNCQFGLTNRERQLVRQIRSGSTNKEIASELNLSEQTVKNHVRRILRKLGVCDRLAAAEICHAEGLLS
jgi:DNA-binding NarL/FixJ family response regulator